MTLLRSRPAFAVACVLLVAILFVARPGVGRLRTRIVQSIGAALGRTVEANSVTLRFLPHPGFELENFVVHDIPAFGAEPILRSTEVTAELRLTSLLRGRLEISRLTLTDPSLNLVRNSEGHWNLENLLERTAENHVAPTGQKTQARPGFPYIEADSARINCKLGQEKTAYALTDASFALWQDSENSWGMRLKAKPVRTDSNLSDIGLLHLNGSWQRAPRLRNTPLHFSLRWEAAQLGQASKLFYGSDRGWRGDVTLSVNLSGTPADLAISSRASIDDFHRYDVSAGGSLNVAGQCVARYSSGNHALSQIVCSAPAGRGAISLTGEAGGPAGLSNYDLTLTASDIPLQALVSAAIHAKKDIPEDLAATGNLEAHVRLRHASSGEGPDNLWEGSGETRGFRVQSKLANTNLDLGTVAFTISPNELSAPLAVSTKGNSRGRKISQPKLPQLTSDQSLGPYLTIQPFGVDLGSTNPATAEGLISRTGYSFSVRGDAKLEVLLQLQRAFAIPGPRFSVEGSARVDLKVAGAWHQFTAPRVFGSAQMRSVRAEVRGLNTALEIATANVALAEEGIRFQNVSASLGDTEWRGWVLVPRSCGAPQPCPVSFDLHTTDLSIDRLKELAGAASTPKGSGPKRWYRVFASPTMQQGSPVPLNFSAVGKLSADRLTVGKYTANSVSAEAALLHGILTLSRVKGEFLHGSAEAEWQVDFTAKPPIHSGKGVMRSISLEQLPASADAGWILGTATAIFRVPGAGPNETDASSSASLVVDVRDGLLPHLTLPSTVGPLHIRHFTGRLVFHDSKFEIQDGKLQAPGILYQVRGYVWPGHMLNVNLEPAVGRRFTIRGTLTQPRILSDATVETEAQLKP